MNCSTLPLLCQTKLAEKRIHSSPTDRMFFIEIFPPADLCRFALARIKMKTVARIVLLLMLLPILGCASQLQPQELSQVSKANPEEQRPKSAIPTFTYRPGL